MKIRTRTTLTAATLALTALLASCSTTPVPQAATAGSSPDAVLTVRNPGAASDAQLEARYNGVMIARTPDFALLGVSGAAPKLHSLDASTEVEANSDVFQADEGQRTAGTVAGSGSVGLWGWGSVGLWGHGSVPLWGWGSVGLWGNGSVGLWGHGSVGLWGNGSVGLWGNALFQPVPQNTGTWRQIGLDSVQSAGRASGEGITVAILDTGVDLTHPAYQGMLTDPSTWRDFVSNDATPEDEGELGSGLTGHGTEIAGIIAQVAPSVKIMPLRVLDRDGSGDVSSVSAAIIWAVNHGADVINLSLGAESPVSAVTQAINYANKKGVAVAAAAGNSGAEGVDYPAAQFASMPMNLAVGSASPADAKSAFSQYGAALELLAPGEGVFGPAPQSRLAAWTGTSMSTPMVAAGLALGMGLGATGEQAAAALTGTATPVDTVSGNAPYAGKLGSGRLNLDAALSALGH